MKSTFNISSVLKHAIKHNYLSSKQPCSLMLDLNEFRSRCNQLHHAFQQNGLSNDLVIHTYAVKALPLPSLLKQTTNFNFNMGVECASFGELGIALSSNIPTNKIIFDSPCKTYNELEYCLQNQIPMNLDNFQELDRVNKIIKNKSIDVNNIQIGIRVNPVVDSNASTIKTTATASMYSKFGVNINENKSKLIKAYNKYQPWLNSIHCHIGSQGCPVTLICDGIEKTVKFVEEINTNKMLIKFIDIGGGLPVNYDGIEDKPTFYDLSNELKKTVPILFANKYNIYTEFGRSLIQKCGFIVSKVEYTKQIKNKHIATIHCGANMLLREAYNPKDWKHCVTVYDKNGNVKENDIDNKLYEYDIAGPLCFSGDLIARDITLPFKIQPNDYVVIHDTAGYSLSMYSMYNSRPFPAIYGFDTSENNGSEFMKLLKSEQTNEEIVQFWTK